MNKKGLVIIGGLLVASSLSALASASSLFLNDPLGPEIESVGSIINTSTVTLCKGDPTTITVDDFAKANDKTPCYTHTMTNHQGSAIDNTSSTCPTLGAIRYTVTGDLAKCYKPLVVNPPQDGKVAALFNVTQDTPATISGGQVVVGTLQAPALPHTS